MEAVADQNELLEKEERKNFVKSGVVTGVVMLLLLLLCVFWLAVHGTVPPPEEKKYEIVGGIDFGNRVEGSKKVDNFNDPSPNPSDNPQQDQSQNSDNNTDGGSKSSDNKVIDSDNSNNNTQKQNDQKKQNDNQDKKQDDGKQDGDQKKQDQKKNDGGSNDGKGQETGNDGDPKSPVLDQDGLYNFDLGPGLGKGGRRCLNCDEPPDCNFSTDGNLKVEFCIGPEGTTSNIISQATMNRDQKRCVMQWIKGRTFNEDYATEKLCSHIVVRFRLK